MHAWKLAVGRLPTATPYPRDKGVEVVQNEDQLYGAKCRSSCWPVMYRGNPALPADKQALLTPRCASVVNPFLYAQCVLLGIEHGNSNYLLKSPQKRRLRSMRAGGKPAGKGFLHQTSGKKSGATAVRHLKKKEQLQ